MSVNVKKYSAILLLLMYLMAEVGFGMHRCSIESTSYILPALYSTDCESVHVHELSNSSTDRKEDSGSHKGCGSCTSCSDDTRIEESVDGYFSDLGCCVSKFFSLDIDQLGTNLRSDLDLLPIDLNFDCLVNSTIPELAISSINYANSPPVILPLRKKLTLLSNWRL